MKASICLAALLGLMVSLNSCIYSDDGVHFVSPVPGIPPSFSARCNLDTFSVIKTNDEILVSYSAEIENGILYLVSADVNEQITYDTLANLEADSVSGSMVLRDSFYVKKDVDLLAGENIFDLYFYYSTNSNTLADIVGVEAEIVVLSYFISLEEDAQ